MFTGMNFEDAKKFYKELCKLNHPDLGGSTEKMQEINSQWSKFCSRQTKEENEEGTKYQEIIEQLLKMKLEVEICGSWIWISGNTYQKKEELKKLGCLWSSKKSMWYFREQTEKVWTRKNYSMDEIRLRHGSKTYSATAKIGG